MTRGIIVFFPIQIEPQYKGKLTDNYFNACDTDSNIELDTYSDEYQHNRN